MSERQLSARLMHSLTLEDQEKDNFIGWYDGKTVAQTDDSNLRILSVYKDKLLTSCRTCKDLLVYDTINGTLLSRINFKNHLEFNLDFDESSDLLLAVTWTPR